LQRKTIAVLIDYADRLGSGYESHLRAGFERACHKHGIDLHFIVGRALESPDPISAAHNGIYDLVHGGGVDGTILISSSIGSARAVDRLVRFITALQPTAICSLGVELPGVPSITIENHVGMSAVIEHLIDVHGRRIAFIGGPKKNPDAIARFEVYRQVLDRFGLAFNPQRVALGEFTFPTGMLATNVLLECGTKFDAIAAANDEMALGAIEALRQHGQRVPRDVKVVGFDDVGTARFSSPPLTTARQPLESMADVAVEVIVAQWKGQEPPRQTRLPVELVARRSCGCLFRKGRHSIPCPPPSGARPGVLTREHSAQVAQQLDHLLTQSGVPLAVTGAQLLEAVEGQSNGHRDAFLVALEMLLDQQGASNEFFDDVQMAITLLRDEFSSVGATHFDELWDMARSTIALANARAQAEQRMQIELTYQNLLQCGERLSTAPDRETLKRVLEHELPLIPMNNVFIALCAPGLAGLQPLVAIRDGAPVSLSDKPIETGEFLELVSSGFDRQTTTLALPLTFETKYLGVAVLVPDAGLGACSMLVEQIGFALNTIELHQELAKRTALHERSVQERIAATARMEALSVMAGGVAHDLNSSLSPLVALPDVILTLVNRLGVDTSPEAQRLRAYVTTIKAAAHRATETIRDLMTLGRQGRTPKAPLDLNWVAASCVSAEPALAMRSEVNPLEVEMDLFRQPLLVNASQYHMERAISNLIRNAVEAIGDDGKLTVKTGVVRFEQPTSGLETVAPGEYAMLSISDTGPGIPRDMLSRVFEPFFTNKTLRDSSGSGLGLSIVHGVVKEHEGYIDVVSEHGRGTTFILYFPIARSPSTIASGSVAPDAPVAAAGSAPPEGADEACPGSAHKRTDAA
jgi:DNA-binding LacI/PurR family transcriptional regulator/signal transduction histidine kinase